MNKYTYTDEEVSEALNKVIQSKHWKKTLHTVEEYSKGYEGELPPHLSDYTVFLIRFAQKKPHAFSKLAELVSKIKYGAAKLEYYSPERIAKLEEAKTLAYSVERPNRLFGRIEKYAQSDGEWYCCFRDPEKKPLNELVALMRGSPSEYFFFRNLIEARQRAENRDKRRSKSRETSERLTLLRQVAKFLYPIAEADKRVADFVKEQNQQWDEYNEATKGKIPFAEARKEFLEKYDTQLRDIAELISRAKRGAYIRKDTIKLPYVVAPGVSEAKSIKSKLKELQKWQDSKHGLTRS